MTPQELKNSILKKAFTGKLSKQYESENVEKSEIDNKKNKKMKDYEFDLPYNWELSTLEGVSNSIPSKRYQIKQSQVLLNGLFPVISQSNEFVTGYYNDISKVYNVKDSVVVFGDHTTVVKYIDFDFVVGADGVKIFEPVSIINSKYLYYCLSFVTIGLDKIGGYRRHYKYIKDVAIPVPPLEEQKRIVEKIEELMPLVDEYEKNWEKLEKFNKEFPEDMKKSLIQEAIKGNLVEQRLEEGSSEDILLKIHEEVNSFVKINNIRNNNRYIKSEDNELDFEIPENWSMVKLGEICFLLNGEKVKNLAYPYLEVKYLRGNIEPKIKTSGQLVKADTTIILMDGENSGEVFKTKEIGYLGSTLKILYYPKLINEKFFQYFLLLNKKYLRDNKRGAAIPHLDKGIFFNLILPLPPLQEQKRIVEKLEKLLPLCDQLIIDK